VLHLQQRGSHGQRLPLHQQAEVLLLRRLRTPAEVLREGQMQQVTSTTGGRPAVELMQRRGSGWSLLGVSCPPVIQCCLLLQVWGDRPYCGSLQPDVGGQLLHLWEAGSPGQGVHRRGYHLATSFLPSSIRFLWSSSLAQRPVSQPHGSQSEQA